MKFHSNKNIIAFKQQKINAFIQAGTNCEHAEIWPGGELGHV